MKRFDLKKRALLPYVFFIGFQGILVHAQVKEYEELQPRTGILAKPEPTISQLQSVVLEAPVNPENYVIGPSDGLSVNIWTTVPISQYVSVTPEGSVIIPTVGEIHVADLTLSEAKKKIEAQIRRKYSTGDITVSLVLPRTIEIYVTGNVSASGKQRVPATQRADAAFGAAKPTVESSSRHVLLTRRVGSRQRLDFPKFYATKDDRWNPYLREGDYLFVPRTNIGKDFVSIHGDVNVPTTLEYVEGETFLDLVQLAFGFTKFAMLDSVEISRLDSQAVRLTTTIIDARKILENPKLDFPLHPSEHIIVKAKPELRGNYIVSVDGEVIYPGVYPITKQNTKLSEVIFHAGGFTRFADLSLAELVRTTVDPGQIVLERLLSSRGSISPEDSLSYVTETEIRLRKEVVGVDFKKLFADKDTTQDIILLSGDYISIPTAKRSVYVFGQVVTPGHVIFAPGQSLNYYIEKAGGVTDRARKGDLRIIKHKTNQWLDPRDTQIESGDYIWIPKEPEHTFSYYMTIYSQAASILAVVATMALVIVTVAK